MISKKKVFISILCGGLIAGLIFIAPSLIDLVDLMRAKKACRENRTSECVNFYEEVKKKDPNFGFVRWRLANAYKQNGQFKEAEQEYLWVIKKYPKHKPAYHNLGITYQELKNFTKALTAYQKAIDLKPDAWDSWFGEGAVLLYLKKYEEGVKALKKSIELNPDYEIAYNLLCPNLNEMKKYEEVLSYTQKYLSRNKAKSSFLFQTAVLSAEMLKKEAVAMSYRKAGLDAFPKDYFLNWDLALEEVKTNPEDARKRLEYLKTVDKTKLNDVERYLDLEMIERGLSNPKQ